MLKVKNIHFAYGELLVLNNVNFYVQEGLISGLIGSNGAGKSTTLLTISGINRAISGSIEFCDEHIEHLSPHEITYRGLIHIPEGRELFPSLTVLENLEMGAAISSKTRHAKKKSLEKVFELFAALREKKKQLAASLSGGEQQMLAIGRGLMSSPRLLMLDEPSLGLAPSLVKEVFHMVTEINSHGVTILLVEQNARRSLEISENVFVLENGTVALQGKGRDLLQNEQVKKIYLGL